jgi:phosphoesterase RecJ-like protein
MGSCLALAWALRSIDADALVFNEDGMPDFLHFLTLPGPVLTSLDRLPCEPELVVCLDCGDRARLGESIQPLLDRVPTVNIDHHLANPHYGTAFNWVDTACAATGELVALIAMALRAPLQGALAEALYVAISTDTGNFSYGNTTAQALRLTADMLDEGLNISRLREKLENNWNENRLRLWGRLMQESRILEDGKLAVSLITRDVLNDCHASREDAEGFVEQLRRLSGVRVAMILREEEKDGKIQTKVSLRSSGKDNVRDVAAQFGGGGHRNAAGAAVPLDAEKTLTVIQPYIRFVWNRLQ